MGLRKFALGFAALLWATTPMRITGASVPVEVPLQILLASAADTEPLLWDLARWRHSLQLVYLHRHYAPLWFAGEKLTGNAQSLLRELEQVETRGLLARDYAVRDLRQLVNDAMEQPSAERLARADLALSVTAVRVASDLQRGRIAPTRLGYDLDLNMTPFDAGPALITLAGTSEVRTPLDAFEPQLQHYALLKRSLALYRGLARHPDLTVLPPLSRPKLQHGDTYAGVVPLRRLLVALGDLPEQESLQTGGSNVLDGSLVAALRRFQARMGLEPDGILGRGTYRALTTPLEHRVEQIVLSMERVRWLPRNLATPPIIVNIPQFRLFAFRTPRDAAQDILQMDVIVGAAFDERETPVFAANMRYVVLNPYWDVPFDIMKKELLPEIEADADWVDQNGYQIVDGPGDDARPVAVTEENVLRLAAGRLRVRQLPGPANALGRVKFIFPNAHNVYLHDTPARALFKQSRRAFSHGCIRVSDPMALLTHVLRDDPTWTPQRIEDALNGPLATRILLARPIPVLIVYGTALATEAGEMLFFDDLYAQDAPLLRLIASRRP